MLVRQIGSVLTADTPAKLNLFLEVRGRRADGFHELDTLMVSVRLYDTLRFESAPAGQMDLTVRTVQPTLDPIPTGKDNLVLRAAELLQAHAGVRRGAQILLTKRIPSAAGLGGGSSDAAATLVCLNRLWELGLPLSELHRLAARLGSDLNFFLASCSAAVCTGRGEQVDPVPLHRPLHVVVASPHSGLSTAEVFRHCTVPEVPRSSGDLAARLAGGLPGSPSGDLYNALQAAAERINPDIVRLRKLFSREPVRGHLMSGSGTSYFGLCATRRHARTIAARLRATGTARVFVASTGV